MPPSGGEGRYIEGGAVMDEVHTKIGADDVPPSEGEGAIH